MICIYAKDTGKSVVADQELLVRERLNIVVVE